MVSPFRIRFLIVGTYRSGTSAIVEAVGRHPSILCGMEWTHRLAPWRKIQVAKAALSGEFSGLLPRHRDLLAASAIDTKTVIGFKCLFRASNKWLLHPRLAPALAMDRFGAYIRWLRNDPLIRIVHIVRQDNIAWLKSKALADATSRYAGGTYPDELQLSISVGEAKRRVATKIWIDLRLAALSITNPYLRVNYESFVSDNLAVAGRIVEFLDCDSKELPMTELRHQSQSRASRATILNAGEIRRALGPLGQPPANS